MPFVKRDHTGRIVAMFNQPQADAPEMVASHSPEVTLFLYGPPTERGRDMLASDLELVRVIEDLIEVMVGKNVIQFSDLPDAVRQKVFMRKEKRRAIGRT
jgi:hypothetical protein